MIKLHIDNGDKASHGEALNCIYDTLMRLIPTADVLVREKGFSRFPKETQALFKVVGIADLAAWQCGEKMFDELAPAFVKKLLTGSGRASKQDVAEALLPYVGNQEYACDDESDAVAIGIAWLIQNNEGEMQHEEIDPLPCVRDKQ